MQLLEKIAFQGCYFYRITEPHVEVILNNTTKSPLKVFMVMDALKHRSLIFICNSQDA